MSYDIDIDGFLLQKCEACDQWCDENEIDFMEEGGYRGLWLCYDCQLGEASAV